MMIGRNQPSSTCHTLGAAEEGLASAGECRRRRVCLGHIIFGYVLCRDTCYHTPFFASMESEVHRLRSALLLTEDEECGMVVLDGLWHAGSEMPQLCLVGRSLSNRVLKFDALSTSIWDMVNPIKGMDIKQ
ncbi:UNVERIFIED_CONTAM: hypothetical protein Sradi_0170800 [Sesamum radiatum]|uniref:Uncharacterized protein n=1 Tax=Sesamum radiatum TaxID=300843 RepID=A0AAW2VYA5_SESRA